ncbi:MAG TPA: histidine kinase [Terracidiphilus sp.]|jgi:two-component sensor histidine kinase
MKPVGSTRRKKVWLAASALLLLSLIVCAGLAIRLRYRFVPSERDLQGGYFSRSDSWNALGGSWIANANGIDNDSGERGAKLITRAAPRKDLQIDVDIQIAEPIGVAGVILRSSGEEDGVDAYRGYFAGIRSMDSSIELGRADFGWHALAQVALPGTPDSQGWFHMHVIAVGCRLGMTVTAPSGEATALRVDDEKCIRSGSFGLRSSFSSAKWKNLRVTGASDGDLAAMGNATASTADDDRFLLSEPLSAKAAGRFAASMRVEAVKHRIQPGATPISFYRLLPGPHTNVTIVGSIISLPPVVDIQDSTGTILVSNIKPDVPIKLGDVVEARGTLVSDHFRSWLEDATLRVLWSDEPYPPLVVTAEQLTGGTYRGRLIEVEGTLISAQHLADGYELVLKDGDQTFKAFGQSDFHLDLAALEPGSRLRLRGNAIALDQFTHGVYPFTVAADRVDLISPPPWWSPIHIVWLALGCLVLAVCVLWGLHRVQAWHVRSLLKEREELAFEMHDTLAQSFTGIAYQLQAATMETRGQQEVRAHVENALDLVRMSHKEASRTIAALRPQYRAASDIVAALKELAERLSDGGNLHVKAQVEGKDVELPLTVTDALFRIGQEAVTNAVQHADCRNLKIFLALTVSHARLIVQDDGNGISPQAQSNGLGIAGMKNRASKIKAHFDCTTGAIGGTCVKVVAPLPPASGFMSKARAFAKAAFTHQYLH